MQIDRGLVLNAAVAPALRHIKQALELAATLISVAMFC